MIGKHDLQINDGPELLSLEALQQRGRWHHRTRIIDAKFKAGFFRFTARQQQRLAAIHTGRS